MYSCRYYIKVKESPVVKFLQLVLPGDHQQRPEFSSLLGEVCQGLSQGCECI